MAEGLNKVMLLGNVGQDPELRMTHAGQAVLSLRMATNYRVKRGDQWEERAEWHSVVVFGNRAQGLAARVSKGTKLFVEGSLRTSSYEGQDGTKRYKTEVIAKNVLFAGGMGGRRGPTPDEGGSGSDAGDDYAEAWAEEYLAS